MRVVWFEEAREGRNQVANYIGREFGWKRKKRFLQDVREKTQMLKISPNIGQIDSLFANRVKTYRSVVINGLNKMVYYVEDNTIYIAAFWDTRADADQQAQHTGR